MAKNLKAKLHLDAAGFKSAWAAVEGRVTRGSRKMGAALGGFGRRLTSMPALIAGAGIGVALRGAFNASSAAEETRSQFGAVFKDLTQENATWAASFASNFGRARTAVQGQMASMQDTFVPLGIARKEAAQLSRGVVSLAHDLSSFKNIRVDDVMRDMQSALVGNFETMRKYGVVINETVLKNEALRQGFAGSYQDLSPLQKGMLAYQIILDGTSDAQGDLARTSDSTANRVRAMGASWREMNESAGAWLTNSPLIHGALTGISTLFSEIAGEAGKGRGEADAFRASVARIGGAIGSLGAYAQATWSLVKAGVKGIVGGILEMGGGFYDFFRSIGVRIRIFMDQTVARVMRTVAAIADKGGRFARWLGLDPEAARETARRYEAEIGALRKRINRKSAWTRDGRSISRSSLADYNAGVAGLNAAAEKRREIEQRLLRKKTATGQLAGQRDLAKKIFQSQTTRSREWKKLVQGETRTYKAELKERRRAAEQHSRAIRDLQRQLKDLQLDYEDRMFRLDVDGKSAQARAIAARQRAELFGARSAQALAEKDYERARQYATRSMDLYEEVMRHAKDAEGRNREAMRKYRSARRAATPSQPAWSTRRNGRGLGFGPDARPTRGPRKPKLEQAPDMKELRRRHAEEQRKRLETIRRQQKEREQQAKANRARIAELEAKLANLAKQAEITVKLEQAATNRTVYDQLEARLKRLRGLANLTVTTSPKPSAAPRRPSAEGHGAPVPSAREDLPKAPRHMAVGPSRKEQNALGLTLPFTRPPNRKEQNALGLTLPLSHPPQRRPRDERAAAEETPRGARARRLRELQKESAARLAGNIPGRKSLGDWQAEFSRNRERQRARAENTNRDWRGTPRPKAPLPGGGDTARNTDGDHVTITNNNTFNLNAGAVADKSVIRDLAKQVAPEIAKLQARGRAPALNKGKPS